jgi:TonB family protein
MSFLSTFSLQAQSTEAELKTQLMHKPLYVRGCWRHDQLHFDSNGVLTSASSPITFTLCGFDLKTLHLKNDKLVLEGVRAGLELADDKVKRISLGEDMRIEIDANPKNDYGPALNSIFVSNLEDLVPSMPFYWQNYAKKHFVPSATPSESSEASDNKPQRIGGAITAPVLIRSAPPQYSPSAEHVGYGGNVLIRIWIQPDGTVSHPSIVRPIGLGLDENALAAVLKYLFKPAMQDGKPVLVEVNIQVNFQS